jgi:hypothetical protein
MRCISFLYNNFKAFVQHHKNDAIDVEAIVETASRPAIRAVDVKDENPASSGNDVPNTRDVF